VRIIWRNMLYCRYREKCLTACGHAVNVAPGSLNFMAVHKEGAVKKKKQEW
jgi:hypothetical protein